MELLNNLMQILPISLTTCRGGLGLFLLILLFSNIYAFEYLKTKPNLEAWLNLSLKVSFARKPAISSKRSKLSSILRNYIIYFIMITTIIFKSFKIHPTSMYIIFTSLASFTIIKIRSNQNAIIIIQDFIFE